MTAIFTISITIITRFIFTNSDTNSMKQTTKQKAFENSIRKHLTDMIIQLREVRQN